HGAHYKSGGSHSSDVVPGKFHSTVEYEPWIELAVHLCREEYFSKTIGIELEACNQLERVHAAKSIIERLIDAAVPTEGDQSSPEKEGCILTLDIGNSTKGILFEGGNEGAVSRLQNLIESGVELVFRNQGEIVSFGGDGFIALFEKKRFDRENRVAENTFNAIRCLRDWWIEIRKEKAPGLQLRIGVHFGNVSILSTNRLRGQALSLDLVTSVRLCDNCKEEAKSDHNKFFCLLSEEVKELFEKAQGLLAEEKRQLQAEIASREEETAERLLERENRLLRDELELLVGLNFVHFPPVEINGKERTRYWIVWPNSSTLNPGE
ncbi:MAG: hypothetical protein KDM91_15430, partial [Verrucomicrobiae bacterium]|nr:hypothetical protein [Verrucomicrobiae bacterium]